jgi:hypothetical protein
MFGGNNESDKSLLKSVNRRLERTGTQSRLSATVQRGTVTLRGKLRFENQRMTIVKAINGVSGVRNVVDQLVGPPKMRPSPTRHESAPPVVTSNDDNTLVDAPDAIDEKPIGDVPDSP